MYFLTLHTQKQQNQVDRSGSTNKARVQSVRQTKWR